MVLYSDLKESLKHIIRERPDLIKKNKVCVFFNICWKIVLFQWRGVVMTMAQPDAWVLVTMSLSWDN